MLSAKQLFASFYRRLLSIGLGAYVVLCGLFLLGTAGFGLYLWVGYARQDIVHTLNANSNLRFNVHYVDNNIWGSGPVDNSYDFLMSFVDYITVESTGTLSFSETMVVSYSYHVTEQLIIRSGSGADVNALPVVYTQEYLLSEGEGEVTARNLRFGNPDDGMSAGGSFVLDPIRHIETYRQFIHEQTQQMDERNLQVAGGRAFSADMVLTIVVRFSADDTTEQGIRFGTQTLTTGYRIPLTNEVFMLHSLGTGISSVSASHVIGLAGEITTGHILFLASSVVVNVWGIVYVLSLMTRDNNKIRYRTDRLIKKYTNEVLVVPYPHQLSGHPVEPVSNFKDLLKLGVNLNKHITCYRTDDEAHFYVAIDGLVYHYHEDFTQWYTQTHATRTRKRRGSESNQDTVTTWEVTGLDADESHARGVNEPVETETPVEEFEE